MDVVAAVEAHLSAVDPRLCGTAIRRSKRVAPTAAKIDPCAGRNIHRTTSGRQQCRGPAKRRKQISGFHLPAGNLHRSTKVDAACGESKPAALLQPERAVEVDTTGRCEVHLPPSLGAQHLTVQPHGIALCFPDWRLQRPRPGVGLERSNADIRVEHRAAPAVVETPEPELGVAGRRRLCLRVALLLLIGPARLLCALEGHRIHLALQNGRGRRDQQAASIASHGIAIVETLGGCHQRIAERFGHPPSLLLHFIALVQTVVQHLGRCIIKPVQLPVAATQPALLHHAGLHIQAATGQIDARTGVADHFLACQLNGAALRRPFADRMPLIVQVATHFQQAAAGIPARAFITAGTGGNFGQLAAVDPHLAADQLAAVTVVRRIAQLIALHLHLDVVAFHRHLHTHRTGDVHARAIIQIAAPAGVGDHLAAGGHRQRTGLEVHIAAGDDFDAGLLTAVLQAREIVEGATVAGTAQLVLLGRFLDERVALAVQRRALAIVFQQYCRGRASGQGHAAGRIGRRVQQVHRTALVQRGGRNRNAGLLDGAAGQRDIAFARLDQTTVANTARRAVSDEARGNLIAAGGGRGVLGGSHAATDHETVTGGQLGLSLAGFNLARVFHAVASQQHITAAPCSRGRFVRGDARTAFDHDLAHGVGQRRGVRVGTVQALLAELRIADACGRCHQIADIDLAVVAEHHTVAVGHEHRAIGLQLAKDLAGPCGGIIDPVQHGPVGVLQEIQCGVATNVEGFPVQDRLVGGLLDVDQHPPVGRLRLDRVARIDPATRQRILVNLQAILAQAIGHYESRLAARLPCLFLQALLQGDGLRGRTKVVDRLLQLLPCRILLLRG
ncbi:Uncharacterised protein [Stenotrophomonas maltophilia]|nr:Uncharacterised protein [Stenotrophomonas maltophilia]